TRHLYAAVTVEVGLERPHQLSFTSVVVFDEGAQHLLDEAIDQQVVGAQEVIKQHVFESVNGAMEIECQTDLQGFPSLEVSAPDALQTKLRPSHAEPPGPAELGDQLLRRRQRIPERVGR